jgi:hypothetical protein
MGESKLVGGKLKNIATLLGTQHRYNFRTATRPAHRFAGDYCGGVSDLHWSFS